MSGRFSLKDGSGTDKEAKVDESGPQKDNSLWVHINGITPEISLPTFNAPVSGSETFDQFLLNGASEQMAVDGSVTAVPFRLEADLVKDIVITDIVIAGTDGSIKFTNWFAFNSPLTNGVELSFKSDDVNSLIDGINTTSRLIGLSSGDTVISSVTGEAIVVAFRSFDPALIIRRQGFHESGVDDFIQVLIQDNMTGMADFTATARGIKVDSGVF